MATFNPTSARLEEATELKGNYMHNSNKKKQSVERKVTVYKFKKNPRPTFSKALASLPGTLYQHFGSPLEQN